MAQELAFVLINPYTIAKSRTGGIIARYLARADLTLVAVRMFAPSLDLVTKYADLVRHAEPESAATRELLANYITAAYMPHPSGKPQRVMLLLFEGEDAVHKVWSTTGSATLRWGSGETIRDTYGDYIVDENNAVRYFEPAVLVAPTKQRAIASLGLWAQYSEQDGGLTEHAVDVPSGDSAEKTLVLIKPDSFRYHRARPGNIIDILSSSGLRIIGAKKFSMTVAQAEEFYRPVREALKERFRGVGGARVSEALQREFGFTVTDGVADALCRELAPLFAESQFDKIVKFMTGHNPSECSESDKAVLGSEECLALVYKGVDAVVKIRAILGATDPDKAKPGSVRREFGSDVMVNSAHASDSAANAEREMGIIRVGEDTVGTLFRKYYGNAGLT